jgi:energy-converting hydrogenase Eha subunit C
MSRKQLNLLATLLIVFGAIGVVVASFLLERNLAWLSILFESIISTIVGILLIDVGIK